MFHYHLPGHPDRSGAPGDDPAEQPCAVCGRHVSDGERLIIAGVALHLACAVARRRAARS
jgi:hypothetical protein